MNLFLPTEIAHSLRDWFESWPTFFAYTFNLFAFVLAPMYFAACMDDRKFWKIGWIFAAIWSVVTVLTGANGFLIFFMIMACAVFRKYTWPLIPIVLATVIIGASRSNSFVEAKSKSHESIVNYLGYRLYWAPLEVRETYFKAIWPTNFGLNRGGRSPAEVVGSYYNVVFPDWFSPTAKAYGSFDADAYARWGKKGQAVAWWLVYSMFAFLLWAYPKQQLGRNIWWCSATHFFIMLPQAGLLAIFFSQWYWIWLLILLRVRAVENKSLALQGNDFGNDKAALA